MSKKRFLNNSKNKSGAAVGEQLPPITKFYDKNIFYIKKNDFLLMGIQSSFE